MKTRKFYHIVLRGLIGAGVLWGMSGQEVWCADAASFKTKEYYASTGLDLINAADAYALGYTGKGITLGVCDQYVQFYHPEFSSKTGSRYIGVPPSDYDWVENNHATHVAGIMAAAKDNTGMHGVAFDANLLSGNVFVDNNIGDVYSGFNQDNSVKIINNSWGRGIYIDTTTLGKEDIRYLMNSDNDEYSVMRHSILDYDKVLVFAAGNAGHASPDVDALFPYLYPEAAGNFINVIALNSYAFKGTTTGTNAVALFSDLSKYVEENSISSPGLYINSANSVTGGYVYKSGTSMATPYVSASAGLVQEAFPYMTGSQIVDTVLSTANNTFTLPKYTLTVQEDGDEENPTYTINTYYFGTVSSIDEVKADLRNYYNNNSSILQQYGYATADDFANEAWVAYQNTPRELVFGQGLLDVGKAVRGPGLLNARRMDFSNYSPANEFGKAQALYSIDTQGYNSVWSNDIAEKRAGLLSPTSTYADLQAIYNYYWTTDWGLGLSGGREYINTYNAKAIANGLLDLPVGLYKKGNGILALTGQNTYSGSSIAAGGVLQIDGSVAGDAYSILNGTIAGSGSIAGNLYNRAGLQAGSYGTPGTLSVGGNLISSSQLAVVVQNNVAGKIAVAGTADINGTSLTTAAGNTYRPDTSYTVLTASNITGNFASGTSAVSGLLSAHGSQNGTSAFLEVNRQNNIASPNLRQQTAYLHMNAMYDALAGNTQRQMDTLYNLNTSSAAMALNEIYGGAQVNQSLLIQRSGLLSNALTARLDHLNHNYQEENSVPAGNLSENDLAAKGVIPLELDTNNGWWMKFTRSGGSIDAYADEPEMKFKGLGIVVGRDWQSTPKWRTGWIFGYEKSDNASASARSDANDYRLGFYGDYSQDAFDSQVYLACGHQTNASTRYLRQLGLTADSHYSSHTISLGFKEKYNLYEGRKTPFKLSPYVGMDITRYTQDSYREQGAGIYNQVADRSHNTYSTGEIGLEWERSLKQGHYGFNVGYKKVLGGYDPQMTVAYGGNLNDKLTISGGRQDREYLVWELNAEELVNPTWSISGRVGGEKGSNSHYWNASLMFRHIW
ncbi:S8 family serine peptidase [Sporomusa silvacetica]|uniref:S8 family serine peptidase n=1 Tax=Sporomusa silvacetica TaxID=55504 RepID=UPI000B99EC34|nr:autotransporter serine protease [Sporomusa silvacetica]